MTGDLHKTSILVVEDSIEYQVLIKAAIGESPTHSYVDSLEQARQKLRDGKFDVILLDLVLPDGLGFELCSEMGTNSELSLIPVIILSTRSDVTDKVLGLSMGAHDYVTKPFDPLELRARILSRINLANKFLQNKARHINGNLCLEESRHKVLIQQDDRELSVELSHLETKLLSYFLKHSEQVLSRQMLLDGVWGNETHVLDRSVDSAVSGLRKKLESWNCTIQSVYGAGYKVSKKQEIKREMSEQQNPFEESDFLSRSPFKQSPELFATISNMFLSSYQREKKDLQEAIQKQDFNKALHIVHRLRGVIANFSVKVAAIGELLECELAENVFSQKNLDHFLESIESLQIKIRDQLEQTSPPPKNIINQ